MRNRREYMREYKRTYRMKKKACPPAIIMRHLLV